MRYILALIMAVPLLLAGSAWAGTYDGEWSGSGVVECDSQRVEHHIRFIVAGSSFEGNFGEGTVSGSLVSDGIKGRAWEVEKGYYPVLRLKGSLRTGLINLSGFLGGTSCLGEAQVAKTYEDYEEGEVEEVEDDLRKYFLKAPTEKEVQEMDNVSLCRVGEIYEIPFVVAGIKNRYLKCDKLLEMFQEEPVVGNTFRDCPVCPEMVVVPAGEFMMGSPESEKGRKSNEGPVHHVSVRQPFAIGKYEVTFAEWDACVSGGGCNGYRPDDEGWGRGDRPVINVNYMDAKTYTAWLSRKTGHAYRLPSEAEWEYAARARTTKRFHFGNSINSSEANYGGTKTVAVGSYPANAFGLHDVHGNVWEWVKDCWTESYAGAPSDTNVWKAGNCSRGVLRGGSWGNGPKIVRSAYRNKYRIGHRRDGLGFRISRTLP